MKTQRPIADGLTRDTGERGSGKPGARTLTESLRPVQRRAEAGTPSDPSESGASRDDSVHQSAERGVSGGGESLPHGDRIQAAFGHHDVSGVRAHVGGEAATSAREIGAVAYATGDRVAFRDAPDLHTAAHEAAHVVQQRAGVHLKGGVGAEGDSYERHADAVADAVVRGESAAGLLDEVAPGGGTPSRGVQMRTDMDAEAQADRASRRAEAEQLLQQHQNDDEGLARLMLQRLFAGQDILSGYDASQAIYQVLDRAGARKASILAAMARQLDAARLRQLQAMQFGQGVAMALGRQLRAVGNVAEAERVMGVLVSPEHAHMLGESATRTQAVQGALGPHGASIQSVTGGIQMIVYDEYWIVMDAMPSNLSPEAYLTEMSVDLNQAVNNEVFDDINVFRRTQQDRNRGAPAVGDVYDIDILGPDNGSVMLVERAPSHFIFQTVTTSQTGAHPEYGSRQFGFQRQADGSVRWYTRGVSSPSSDAAAIIGGRIQRQGWTAMLQGIGNTLASRGGRLRSGSFGHWIRRG